MVDLYEPIGTKLNIDKETFDQIISDESAKQEICKALFHCLENVPKLSDIASEMLQYISGATQMYSAYNEWIEENMYRFENDDEETAFSNFKTDDGLCPKEASSVDEVDKAFFMFKKSRHIDASDDTEWITVKGTHIPLDDEGNITGKIAEKIMSTSKNVSSGGVTSENVEAAVEKVKTAMTEPDAPTMEGDFEKEGFKKNSEGHWVKKANTGKPELSKEAKPVNTDHNFSLEDSFDDFMENNAGTTLQRIYDDAEDHGEDGSEAIETEYYKLRLQACTAGLHKVSRDEADEILYDNLHQGTIDAWFREYNHEAKGSLITQITRNPEVHNAALNVMYQNYMYFCKSSGEMPLSYDEFLVTPVTMYRGGNGKEHERASAFSAYTFDRKVAESFTGSSVGQGAKYDPNGVIYEAKIRPIDTYGSVFENGEAEIMVPSFIAPNGRFDSSDENMDGGPGSGNFGHKGRPGEIGGSAPDDGSENTPSEADEQRAKDSLLSMTKRKANDQISQIAFRNDDYETKKNEVVKLLNSLPVGSKIKTPDHWNDSGKGDVLIWSGEYWSTGRSFYNGGWSCKPEELADYLLTEDPTERPLVTSIASTPEEMKKWEEQHEKTYWRNQESVWKHGGGLKETTTIKMRQLDVDSCGDGFCVVGSDGKTYTKLFGEWVDKETYRKADMRKLKSPKFTGDFFDINFGINGISSDECEHMRKNWESFNPKMKSRYESMLREGTFQPALGGKCSHYDPRTGIIHFDRDSDANTIIHELSHKLDYGSVDTKNSEGYTVHDASVLIDNIIPKHLSDFEHVAKAIGIDTNGDGWFAGWDDNEGNNFKIKIDAFERYIEFRKKYLHVPGFEAVADAISGQTMNQISTTHLGGGHEEEYWLSWFGASKASNQSCEYWANFCMCKACGYNEALDILKEVTPDLYSAADSVWKEIFNGESS